MSTATPVQAPALDLTPPERSQLEELTRQHLHEAYEIGRLAGEAKGYVQGWRRGLVNGLVLAALAAACAAALLVP